MANARPDFPSVGGRVVLDFVATLGKRDTLRIERLTTPADLGRWARHVGLADKVTGYADALDDARTLREALYGLIRVTLGRGSLRGDDLELVNHWAREDAPVVALSWARGRFGAQRAVPSAQALLGVVARDGVDLLGGPDAVRVRECEGKTCTLLFVDASRGHRRRWCSMDSCGARAKMRALRARDLGSS